MIVELGRRFARLTTDVVVSRPALWRVFRPVMRKQFDRLAPVWDSMRDPEAFAPFEAALDALPSPPARALDVGTGTGRGALVIATRFAGAHVVGIDVSDRMLDRARENVPAHLVGRVSFARADASALPFDDESFDLVTHANMIPFFDEVARVLSPGGFAVFAFSSGPATPIYVPAERLRTELEARGFSAVGTLAAGRGTAVIARKNASA